MPTLHPSFTYPSTFSPQPKASSTRGTAFVDDGGGSSGKKPMRKHIVSVEIDMEIPSGPNDVFKGTKVDRGRLQGSGFRLADRVACQPSFLP